MYNQTMPKAELLFQLKLLKDKVAEFESGEKYVRMQEEYRKNLAFQNRKNEQLKKELSCSHAETVRVRNKWLQTCVDIIKEKDRELAQMEKKLRKMETEKFEALRQMDEALAKLHDKTAELYEVKTQLEEAQGKILELTSRLNRDYTNSSLSSSRTPSHTKIPNSRETTGRRPGGQRGHIHYGRKRLEPTRTVEIPAPEKYTNTPGYKPTGRFIRKQLVCLHVSTEVIEYVTPRIPEPGHGPAGSCCFSGRAPG